MREVLTETYQPMDHPVKARYRFGTTKTDAEYRPPFVGKACEHSGRKCSVHTDTSARPLRQQMRRTETSSKKNARKDQLSAR